ncbi:DNA polymerase delta subunit 4 isoform 1-T1 [Erethizon dorsatum]
MGRKRLITDSYPVVKRREGPAGHSKGELASELGEEPQLPSEEQAELELLRQFDLAWEYGPCTGITRLQRWHRAEQMGLEPPPEVCQVLKSHPGDPRFQYRSGQAGLGGGSPGLREKWTQVWGSLLSRQEGSSRCLAQEGMLTLISDLLVGEGCI